ncbi:MAG: ribbon-helix-helix protein, CopG family [Gemmatimonadota bacterium]
MVSRPKRSSRVSEPVQAYLDSRDMSLLEQLTERTGLSKAETIRQALRRLGQALLAEPKAGSGAGALIGVLDTVPASDAPADLSARHDDYLYGDH